jgi:ketosteroid isomerase-like protein
VKQLLTTIIITTVVASTSCLAQNSSNNLQRELERLHNQWFNAFDKGDGAAMDKMEIPNLILINADGKGGIWEKHGPRAGKQKPTGNSTRLINLQVRQFGNSAILTGVVTIKDGQESARSSTTVVWVRKNNQWLVASAQWSDIR